MSKFKKIIFLSIICLSLSACGNGTPEDEIDYEDDVKDLITEHESDKVGVRGSCNVIATKSSCVDFVGSVFTEERMRLSCAEGVFSKNTCPYSELGGCMATPGTISESVVWMYDHGGQPVSAEDAKYAKMSCEATGVGKWVTSDEFSGVE